MRICDLSSDVCSSDLIRHIHRGLDVPAHGLSGTWVPEAELPCMQRLALEGLNRRAGGGAEPREPGRCRPAIDGIAQDRKSVVAGKSVAVRVNLGGRRHIHKNKDKTQRQQMDKY